MMTTIRGIIFLTFICYMLTMVECGSIPDASIGDTATQKLDQIQQTVNDLATSLEALHGRIDRASDPCLQQPCQNYGSCMSDNSGDYQCQCHDGFIGKNCELEAWYNIDGTQHAYKLLPTSKDWFDAQWKCWKEGGYLAVVDTTSERDAIVRAIEKHPGFLQLNNFKHFTVGATELGNLGSWYWVDGTPLSSQNSVWATGQPDNNRGTAEYCSAFLKRANAWNLHDVSCSSGKPALCERNSLQ